MRWPWQDDPDDFAPEYNREHGVPAEEYLSYINHKLGYTNKLLKQLILVLSWLLIAVGFIAAKQLGYF